MDRQQLLAPFGDPAIFKDWDVRPILIGDQHAATVILNGTEMHFYAVPAFRRRGWSRRRVHEFIEPLLEQLGFLTTRVLHARGDERKFVERIGFKPTWVDDHFQYYMLGRLPFGRSE